MREFQIFCLIDDTMVLTFDLYREISVWSIKSVKNYKFTYFQLFILALNLEYNYFLDVD